MKTILTFTLAVLWFASSSAQPAGNLQDHRSFFSERTADYQQWLNESPIGKVFQVEHLDVRPDTLFLYLAFQPGDYDYQLGALEQLRNDFSRQHFLSLEEQLFYKAAFFYEIAPEKLVIQLFDTYDPARTALYWLGIHFHGGAIAFQENKAKPILKSIHIEPADFSGHQKSASQKVDRSYSKEEVYQSIYRFLQEKYQQQTCPDNQPRLFLRESQKRLWVQVDNLCREALYDQTNNVLCRILKRLDLSACNTIKRERYHFIVGYEPTETGFELEVVIDGEYSTNYLLGYGQYRKMDHRFMEYFQLYADVLIEEMNQALVP